MKGLEYQCNACPHRTPYYAAAQRHAYAEHHPRIRFVAPAESTR